MAQPGGSERSLLPEKGEPTSSVESTHTTEWWAVSEDDLFESLASGHGGLTSSEASQRLVAVGPNSTEQRADVTPLRLLVNQLRSPLVLILVFAAVVSGIVSEWLDSIIILSIVLGSSILGFFQEYRASSAVEELRARVKLRARVRRDGGVVDISADELVPGDVVILATGGLVPADGRVITATDCHVSEAVLTGETYPVEKTPGTVGAESSLGARSNSLWMGTTMRAGTAEMLVVATGLATEYGKVAKSLATKPPETAFELGIRQFGHLLAQLMVVLVVVVFLANVIQSRPTIDSLLFAIALAVGIAPELLPAIMSINLAHGARRMAEKGVIVRQLSSIENLGSMDVLCTDKTGTLTEGAATLDGGFAADGSPSQRTVDLARVNAALQAGLVGPLDEALLVEEAPPGWDKLAEVPFDFFRKRLSVVARHGDEAPLLICKGAYERILDVCDKIGVEGEPTLGDEERRALIERFNEASRDGWRIVGVAVKTMPSDQRSYGAADERDMSYVGYLRFSDPPKADTKEVLGSLQDLGVSVKVISGDVAGVTIHLAGQVGLATDRVLTGAELNAMSDEALWASVESTELFVEVDPTHKERIVNALRRRDRVVGFMGDGVNDAPALHAADVGVSVDSAVDVAREAASFVLLRHDLGVLRDGIVEGRRTFANTMKYITTTESANFGNMLSMAAASFFLPFLPMTATQVLLNNFLSDFPATTIAADRVDPEMVAQPERWDIRAIRRFMIVFGMVSSAFDFVTFGLLLWVFSASADLFRTGWFIESLLTELVIALVVRTRRPFYKSRPGRLLLTSTIAVAALTFILPYLPFADLLGFVPPSPMMIVALIGVTVMYVIATELTKHFLFRSVRRAATPAG